MSSRSTRMSDHGQVIEVIISIICVLDSWFLDEDLCIVLCWYAHRLYVVSMKAEAMKATLIFSFLRLLTQDMIAECCNCHVEFCGCT